MAGSASFVWNVTASAPQGLYHIDHSPWRVGDRVALLPAEPLATDLATRGILPKGKLLIKRVTAAKGDAVCREGDTIHINGRLVGEAKRVDSHGARLPSWQGCVTLDDGQVFLLGDTAGSYDGRYFGVTQADQIVGRVGLLFAF
jgi:conjugative transfer signal peptidase TraF